ncbi:hypothetical protein I601_3688 [Nocardioides dokdonensis FR1436]|uniref:DUF2752 domain-containing protein n=1 Tax=Nocardioides dokdonensis FR1436 TaxID=1300347 RepID=A0A1A9GR49_9ACTN|nr:DUF2752 domain-containing protein [Nocardioides dokdonensis]ANH40093.1 hypothetical protein I601_3688 [Nocardioides dokdonensis FR1436]
MPARPEHLLDEHVERVPAPPRAPGRAWLPFLATGLLGLGAVAVVAAVDPHEPGHYPTCPFLAVTDLYCPGCGSLRTLNSMAHGDLLGALSRNPLLLLAIPFVVLAYVQWGRRLAGLTTWSPTSIPARWIWGLLVGVLAFWVLRNLPGWDFLSPA